MLDIHGNISGFQLGIAKYVIQGRGQESACIALASRHRQGLAKITGHEARDAGHRSRGGLEAMDQPTVRHDSRREEAIVMDSRSHIEDLRTVLPGP
jgi:hypothetical protein